jgi:response regulator RpfG family c-di-GMP phosphodiesterase
MIDPGAGVEEAAAPARHPAILIVDDEPAVLAAVARDLRRGFGERYRIVRAGSGADALELTGVPQIEPSRASSSPPTEPQSARLI